MKKRVLVVGFLMFFSFLLNAQKKELNNGFGFGFQLSEYQNDFGFGINVVSPYFLKKSVGVRLKANMMFNEHTKNDEITWTPYSNISLGLIGVGGHINDKIRLYGEGGVLGILPSSEFSTEDFTLGGYGLFGFEFFFFEGGNYFIEIGGVGTGAVANKISTKPIYSNGMTLSAGFRFFMK